MADTQLITEKLNVRYKLDRDQELKSAIETLEQSIQERKKLNKQFTPYQIIEANKDYFNSLNKEFQKNFESKTYKIYS